MPKRKEIQISGMGVIGILWGVGGCTTGKWGYISTDDKVAIQPQFEDATPLRKDSPR